MGTSTKLHLKWTLDVRRTKSTRGEDPAAHLCSSLQVCTQMSAARRTTTQSHSFMIFNQSIMIVTLRLPFLLFSSLFFHFLFVCLVSLVSLPPAYNRPNIAGRYCGSTVDLCTFSWRLSACSIQPRGKISQTEPTFSTSTSTGIIAASQHNRSLTQDVTPVRKV